MGGKGNIFDFCFQTTGWISDLFEIRNPQVLFIFAIVEKTVWKKNLT